MIFTSKFNYSLLRRSFLTINGSPVLVLDDFVLFAKKTNIWMLSVVKSLVSAQHVDF